MREAMSNHFNRLGDLLSLLGDRLGALGVFLVNQPDQLQRSEAIEVFGRGISRFGGQMFEHASILVTVTDVRQRTCAKESKICAGPAYDRRLPVIL